MTDTVRTLDPSTLPLHGSRLIEASAGTGKTFTLALLYVRLVLGHRQADQPLTEGVMPPNLLVVTFTEAATKELRDRIRARLTEAAALFGEDPAVANLGTDAGDPLVKLRNQCPQEDWPACQRKLVLAAEWMDEAAVSTIHSWCNRMLSEHAFDSGSLFRQTLETDQTELLDEVARDYWRIFVYPTPPDMIDAVLQNWTDPQSLRKAVRNLLPHVNALPDNPLSPEDAVKQALDEKHRLLRDLKKPWAQWCDELTELLENTAKPKPKPLHGRDKNTIQTAVNHLREWAATDADEPKGLIKGELKGYEYLAAEGFASKWTGAEPAPHHPAMDEISALKQALANLPTPGPAMLNHAVRWIASRLHSEKQRLATMGFDDLLTRLDEALAGSQGEQLAATIARQFPVAMIDEFQDTDPVQYRIFDRIYQVAVNNPDTTLLMIGDPKQAIYKFRGADIYTYLDARQAVSERTYTLGTNFRSSKAMVAGVNQVFSHGDQARAEGAFLFRTDAGNPLPFTPVNAKGNSREWWVENESVTPLTFWTLGGDEGVTKGDAKAHISGACATEVARLLTLGQQGRAGFRDKVSDADLEPLRPEHIAILVNKRDEAEAVRHALGERGIRSVYLSDRNSVLNSPEAVELLQWLHACAEPGQLSLLRGALATASLGLSHQQLDRLLSDENALDREIERFQRYRELWQTQGVLPMLRRFLMDFEVPAKLLAHPEGERALTDILHLAELLQADSQQLDGEHALVHHFTELLQQSDDEDEHRTMRLESDSGLVKVVTVHKSKGLEYPLVFLPFATEHRQEKAGQNFLAFHNPQGQLQISLQPDENALQLADRERLGEDIRKLYVALTRARHATWVGAAGIKNWHLSGLGHLIGGATQPGEGDLTPQLQAMAADHSAIRVRPAPDPDNILYTGEPEPELGQALEPTREARENWWIASYSAITYGALSGFSGDFQPASEDAEQENLREEDVAVGPAETLAPAAEPEGKHAFPKGSGPGTFLHDILEWCATKGFDRVVAAPDELHTLLVRRCQLRHWDDWVEVLHGWILKLLTVELPLPGSEGLLGSPDQTCTLASLNAPRPELEFWFESRQVNTLKLDKLVQKNTIDGQRRPEAHETTFNGMLKGFIDLVFEHQGRYYVLDYKSNVLGDDDSAYVPDAMRAKVLESRYDLQYVIYLLALHRLLKARLPDYDYDTHVGGAIYLFLRGCDAPGAGAFTERPDKALIESLDRLFCGEPEVAA